MPITPKPLEIQIYCRDFGMYLETKLDNSKESPEIAVEACQCPLNEIRKVYEKYKHMDKVMCDGRLDDGSFKFHAMMTFWQAIKTSVETDEKNE